MPIINLVKDLGADPLGQTDITPLLNKARDQLKSTSDNVKGIYLMGGTYKMNPPFVTGLPGLVIYGDEGLTNINMNDYGPGFFIDTFDNIPINLVRPDSYNILDSSVAPQPNVARGFATRATGDPNPRYWIIVTGGPPSIIPDGGWESIGNLTIEYCLDRLAKNVTFFNIGSMDSPSPLALSTSYNGSNGLNQFCFSFRTSKEISNAPRRFWFGDLSKYDLSKPIKVTISISMNTADSNGLCLIKTWINGNEVVVLREYGTRLTSNSNNSSELSFTPDDHLSFMENKMGNLHIGNPGWNDATTNITPTGGRPDFAIHGLSFGTDLPYKSDTSGNQIRTDGGTLNDAYRFLFKGRPSSNLISFFNLDANLATNRFPRFYSRPGYSNMGIIQWDHGDFNVFAPGNTLIKNININMLQYQSEGILVGPILGSNFTVDGVHINNGLRGLVGLNDGEKYDVKVRRPYITGSNVWIQFSSAVIETERLGRGYIVNGGIRLSGCDAICHSITTGDTRPGSYTVELLDIASDYAANYVFNHIGVDNEGQANSPILIERHGSIDTCVVINNLVPGVTDQNNQAVTLIDNYPDGSKNPPRLILNNVQWSIPPYFNAVGANNQWVVINDGQYLKGGSTIPPNPPDTPIPLFSDNFDGASLNPIWKVVNGTWVQNNGIINQGSGDAADPKKIVATDQTYPEDIIVIAKVKVNSWIAGDMARVGIGLRTDVSTGYGYNLVFHSDNNTLGMLDDRVIWGNSIQFPWTVGAWYWFKLQIRNNVLMGKVWADDNSEPPNWMITQAGWKTHNDGYPALNGGSSNNVNCSFDEFTVTIP